MRFLAAVTALLCASSLAAAGERPEARLDDGGRLQVHGLPPVVAEPEVWRQLTTGLTVHLVLRTEVREGRRGRARGGAQIALRYDLWEETFAATVTDLAGQRPEEIVAAQDGLERWWRNLVLTTTDTVDLPGATHWRLEVDLELIPFSEAELEETRRWFADSSKGPSRNTGEALGSAEADGLRPFADTLNQLLAASIRRPASWSTRWTLTLDPSPPSSQGASR